MKIFSSQSECFKKRGVKFTLKNFIGLDPGYPLTLLIGIGSIQLLLWILLGNFWKNLAHFLFTLAAHPYNRLYLADTRCRHRARRVRRSCSSPAPLPSSCRLSTPGSGSQRTTRGRRRKLKLLFLLARPSQDVFLLPLIPLLVMLLYDLCDGLTILS